MFQWSFEGAIMARISIIKNKMRKIVVNFQLTTDIKINGNILTVKFNLKFIGIKICFILSEH